MNANLKCNICLDDRSNIIIFKDCSHHICVSCLGNLNNNNCPYCRRKFDAQVLNIKKSIGKSANEYKVTTYLENDIDFENYFEEYEFTDDDKEKFQIELSKEYLNSWYKYFSF